MKVGDILDLEQADRLERYREQLLEGAGDRVTGEQVDIASANLRRLHALVWIDQPVSFYTDGSRTSIGCSRSSFAPMRAA